MVNHSRKTCGKVVVLLQLYSEVIKRAYIKAIAYRSEVFLWILLDTIPMLVVLLVWVSMYGNGQNYSGYDLSAILQYYFLVAVINGITSTHFEAWRTQEIRDGKVDYFMIRPFAYPLEILLRDIGGKLFYLTFSLPFFAGVFFLISTLGHVTLPTVALPAILTFVGLLFSTYTIEFLIARLIVYVGFWMEYTEGLEHFKWVSITLFSGWMIPIALMPQWLSKLVTALPFKYMYSVPIGVLQGTQWLSIGDIAYLGLFVSSLVALNKLVWHFAQYRYSSSGG